MQITLEDLNRLAAGNVNIVLDGREEAKTGALTIRLVNDQEAAELARREGGRPQDC